MQVVGGLSGCQPLLFQKKVFNFTLLHQHHTDLMCDISCYPTGSGLLTRTCGAESDRELPYGYQPFMCFGTQQPVVALDCLYPVTGR